ncbi:KRAB-A domain-containing protein 2-like [Oopsacas minuta]|uniref:KRAB-A domain-containing protein 2-like n=1 Tax=Oopsacas minuta TaxID=111878 RepID=A0AAV7JJW5_9METZ|nr:KRAB-A domain-containing protein 2-like [Oopsacas minuta]
MNEKWPVTTIIRGKPRHTESQDSLERANQDINKHFTTMILENENDTNWTKYVRLVQYKKNTNYHSTIGMTPFQSIFSRKPPIGLSEHGFPIELVSDISTEEDLNLSIQDLNHTELPQHETSSAEYQIYSNLSSPAQPECSEFLSHPYLEEISQPLPNTVHIYEESKIYVFHPNFFLLLHLI